MKILYYSQKLNIYKITNNHNLNTKLQTILILIQNYKQS